jgi:hypothetical protein
MRLIILNRIGLSKIFFKRNNLSCFPKAIKKFKIFPEIIWKLRRFVKASWIVSFQ